VAFDGVASGSDTIFFCYVAGGLSGSLAVSDVGKQSVEFPPGVACPVFLSWNYPGYTQALQAGSVVRLIEREGHDEHGAARGQGLRACSNAS
jgi:hypothetical protein